MNKFTVTIFCIIIILIYSCGDRNNDNFEDMAFELFCKLKQIESVDEISKFNKFFVNGEEFLDLINKGAIDGKVNMVEYEKKLPTIIESSVISIFSGQVLGYDFVESDKRILEFEKKLQHYQGSDENFINERKAIADEGANYIISTAHEKIKNAKFISATRGTLDSIGALDEKIPRYTGTEINYEIDAEYKHFGFKSFVKTKNGWKFPAYEWTNHF